MHWWWARNGDGCGKELIDLNSSQIKVGMPVKVDFVEREEGGEKKTTLAFRPA